MATLRTLFFLMIVIACVASVPLDVNREKRALWWAYPSYGAYASPIYASSYAYPSYAYYYG
uniref:Uncharacterized protein n=1 Tax=Riptortus pedestris TaxID=329032 RepID=R4WNZ6_RIPPE|nr:unknown secreted protein [Riptortus pedestris]